MAGCASASESERSETIAFGNGYNDVQMLEWAGLGIAVGDAVPEALAAADSVAPPFDEHGVAQVLEELLDKGIDWIRSNGAQ